MSPSVVDGCNSAIAKALDKLGAMPPLCRVFTINAVVDQPLTVTFECYLSQEFDQAVAALLTDPENKKG